MATVEQTADRGGHRRGVDGKVDVVGVVDDGVRRGPGGAGGRAHGGHGLKTDFNCEVYGEGKAEALLMLAGLPPLSPGVRFSSFPLSRPRSFSLSPRPRIAFADVDDDDRGVPDRRPFIVYYRHRGQMQW